MSKRARRQPATAFGSSFAGIGRRWPSRADSRSSCSPVQSSSTWQAVRATRAERLASAQRDLAARAEEVAVIAGATAEGTAS